MSRRHVLTHALCVMRMCRVEEVVDEVYENVQNLEPWMSGNARGPSSAFCLMYRLFNLRISVRDVKLLLDHRDSPYIRAVSAHGRAC